jgi:hypothetical protein
MEPQPNDKQPGIISMDTAKNEIFKHQMQALKRLREAVDKPFTDWLDWSEWRSKAVLISGQTPLKFIFKRSLVIQLIKFENDENTDKQRSARMTTVEILSLELLESYKELTNFLMRGNQP